MNDTELEEMPSGETMATLADDAVEAAGGEELGMSAGEGEEMPPRELATRIAQQADELKAENIVVLDVRRTCTFARYFVLATANSTPHLHALGHRIVRQVRDLGPRPFNVAGFDTTTWVVLDYADVVVHFQSADARDYFRLERLWADAERVDWAAEPVGAAAAASADEATETVAP